MNFDPFLVIEIPILIFAVVLHESSHGWMAEKCGDSTARLLGRITLNPIPHIDLFGSIILPLLLALSHSHFMIGYAKPVPVNYYNLRNPKRDAALVGIAGPLSNISAGLFFLLLLKIFVGFDFFHINGLEELLVAGFMINFGLAIFNLIPIPPLDGSRVVSWLLPSEMAYKYNQIERFGFIIILALMYTGLLNIIFTPVYNLMMRLLEMVVH